MILYHGSNMLIEKIELELSKPNKDFGKSFYLSKIVSNDFCKKIFKLQEKSTIKEITSRDITQILPQ